MTIFYFDSDLVQVLHDEVIKQSGGKTGILNLGLLDSVLEHIKNDLYYPEIADKATHLFYGINKNHCFNDGNKRTSIIVTACFLDLNGYAPLVDRFIKEFENITVHVAENKISKELLHQIICSFLSGNEPSEALKLIIINAICQ